MRRTFLLLVLPTLTVAETFQAFSARNVDAYNDKKISQSEMWIVNNLSKLQCMSECLKDTHCVSFHFSPSESVCVALRERFEGSSVASTNALGYQLYQTNKPLVKLGSDCKMEEDCVFLPYAHCNDGVCRCDVGYGPDGDICRILTECSTFSNNFTVYKSLYLGGTDISSRVAFNNEVCINACIDTAGCKSSEVDVIGNRCYMNSLTWLGAPAKDHMESSRNIFFQRECIW
ncbi:uncharacterized protein [Haliotis asinina]|uniref:uncharacterized protein n=1 Tax=Haliotis asinina TaxID=109174 RepID=UPI00353233F2